MDILIEIFTWFGFFLEICLIVWIISQRKKIKGILFKNRKTERKNKDNFLNDNSHPEVGDRETPNDNNAEIGAKRLNEKIESLNLIVMGISFVLFVSFAGFILDAYHHKEDAYIEFFKIVNEQKEYIEKQDLKIMKGEIENLKDDLRQLINKDDS